MANAVKGEVPLKLKDGRAFTLVLDHEALIEAETAYGKPLVELMIDAARGFAGACRSVLYGALRTHHRDVTLGEATTIFMTDMDRVSAALENAARASAPKPDEGEGEQRSRPRSGRAGKSSGDNGAKQASSRKHSSRRPRERTK